MEERRTAIAIFLCIVVVLVYTQLFLAPPPPAPHVTNQSSDQQRTPANTNLPSDSPAGAQSAEKPMGQNSLGSSDGSATPKALRPKPADFKNSPVTVIETERIIATINHLGGRLSSIKLKDYKANLHSNELVDLVPQHEGAIMPLGIYWGNGASNDDFINYKLENITSDALQRQGVYQVAKGKELSFDFVGTLPTGETVRKLFTFRSDSYLVNFNFQLNPASKDGSSLWLEWAKFIPDIATRGSYELSELALLDNNGKINRSALNQITTDGIPSKGVGHWISLTDKYFMTTTISVDRTTEIKSGKEGDNFLTRISGSDTNGKFILYLGPKDYRVLEQVGFQLEKNIDLGWFFWLAVPLLWAIRFFETILGNYGLAIIVLTLLIKALFLPLTKASFVSMRAMQDLQPEMKALRERIKDPQQLNQELLGLYKKRGVNPMGGCFPVLIQIPVFLGLYNALLNSIELRHAPFALWIQDLSSPEKLVVFGIPIPVMILLMGASMFLQQMTTPPVGDPAQRKMMMWMPVIFTVMFVIFPFPAGLVLYWLVNNIISITQQVYLRRDSKQGPLKATVLASVGVFVFGYILTLL